MRIRRGRGVMQIDLTPREIDVDWFGSLRVGMEAAAADIGGSEHLLSDYEREAVRQFSAELSRVLKPSDTEGG